MRISQKELEDRVARLRVPVDASEVQSLADIPAFDFDLAHGMYNLLFKPFAAAWGDAKSLVVAANGALGMLPLGLLTTDPFTPKSGTEVAFASYRNAPWFARTHAVTFVPSGARKPGRVR